MQVLTSTQTNGTPFVTSWDGDHMIMVGPNTSDPTSDTVKLQWRTPGGTTWYDYDHDAAVAGTFTHQGVKIVKLSSDVVYRLDSSTATPNGWVIALRDEMDNDLKPRGVRLA